MGLCVRVLYGGLLAAALSIDAVCDERPLLAVRRRIFVASKLSIHRPDFSTSAPAVNTHIAATGVR